MWPIRVPATSHSTSPPGPATLCPPPFLNKQWVCRPPTCRMFWGKNLWTQSKYHPYQTCHPLVYPIRSATPPLLQDLPDPAPCLSCKTNYSVCRPPTWRMYWKSITGTVKVPSMSNTTPLIGRFNASSSKITTPDVSLPPAVLLGPALVASAAAAAADMLLLLWCVLCCCCCFGECADSNLPTGGTSRCNE